MINYRLKIDYKCIQCDNCKVFCPENAILSLGGKYVIDNWSCTLCGICPQVCPVDCIVETPPKFLEEGES